MPKKLKDWRTLEFFVPIEEKLDENDELIIRGVAINETTTLNNVKYVAEELEKAAPTFRGVPILLDHKNEVKNIVGRMTENVSFSKGIDGLGKINFEAKIMDKQIKEMIRDGRIQNVSIGAKVDDLREEEDGSMKAIGVKGLELSMVAVPGDQKAFAQALTHSFHLKEMAEEAEEDEAGEEVDEMSDSDIRKKIKRDHPEWDNEEITLKLKMMKKKMMNQMFNANLNPKEVKQMVDEQEVKVPEEEKKEETPVETVSQEKAKEDGFVAEMRKEIEEMKKLLMEKQKVQKELAEMQVKENKTKGEVSEVKEVAIDTKVVVEKALDGNGLAIYRDYSKESSDSKLKRLVR